MKKLLITLGAAGGFFVTLVFLPASINTQLTADDSDSVRETLLTDPIRQDRSRVHNAFYRNPTIRKLADVIIHADELVDPERIDLRRDGHSDAAFEPLPDLGRLPTPPLCTVAAHSLTVWPVSGLESRGWTINNYRDLDPAQDMNNDNQELADYLVAGPQAKTYDQHRGIDIDTPSFRNMDDNSSLVLAAAPGTVETIVEDNSDRNTGWPPGCGNDNNRITVRHPEGFLMSYLHIKKNSASAAGMFVGKNVNAGDVLAVVGSAGCSTQAHLHFQVNDCDGNVVDPFDQTMWTNPPGYNAPLGFMDAVIKQSIPSGGNFIPFMKDPGANDLAVLPEPTFNVGLMMGGGQPGDTYEFEILDPSGDEVGDGVFTETLASVQRRSWRRWNVQPYDEPGTWTFRIFVNNALQGVRTFNVSKYADTRAFKIVRNGIPGSLYQYEFDHAVAAGYRPQFVDAYRVGGQVFFNATWDKGPGAWVARHGLNGNEYDTFVNDQWAKGFRIASVDSYEENGIIKYAVIMDNLAHPGQVARHGQTPAEYQAHFNTMEAAGKVPLIVSSAHDNGQRFITSVFETNSFGTFFAKSRMTSNEFQQHFDDQDAAGRSLLYVNSYNTPFGAARFSGVWVANPPFSAYVTRHKQTNSELQTNFNTFTAQGFTTSIISGYAKGGQHRFVGHWIK